MFECVDDIERHWLNFQLPSKFNQFSLFKFVFDDAAHNNGRADTMSRSRFQCLPRITGDGACRSELTSI